MSATINTTATPTTVRPIARRQRGQATSDGAGVRLTRVSPAAG